ncbi:alpha/beta fold hydrolase [Ideonella sp. BN130291]|uniref:alpha/beta fold hydrolase n=1 Tax=Ideonella sp. BN130291 TaxID=3112940 RepID=UPI002E2577F2|nr:alpha/beta hydrolase [Ideonella sp. BN130291]
MNLFALARLLLLLPLIALLPSAHAQPAVRTGTVDTEDGRLYYELHGDGPPLVLVAGGPGAPRTSLRPEFDQLADRYTVVYLDNIGRGRSSDLPAGRHHSPERDALDIERLRQALGFERIALLGHSYGGYPVLVYAGRFPQRLSHLVISSSGHSADSWQRNIDNVNRFVENQYPEVWQQLQAMRQRGVRSCAPEYQALYGEPIGQLYWHDPAKAEARKPVSTDPRDKPRQAVYCDMIGDDAEVVVGGAMARFDARPALAKVKVPTLITAGRYDPVCPPVVAFQIRDAFPAGVAKVRVFEHSSHRPWAEEGSVYFEALRAFLAAPAAPNKTPG